MNRPTTQLSLAVIALSASMAAAYAQMPAPRPPAPGTAPATQMPMTTPPAGMPMMQNGQPGAMAGDMGRMMEMMRPMMGERRGMGMPFEHVEGRIAYLKAELKITDAQSAAWNAFAETMRVDATAMKTMHDGMMAGGMPTTAPDRMAAQRKMMSGRMAMMDRSEVTMKALYEMLSADQRKSFDQMTSGPMGMM